MKLRTISSLLVALCLTGCSLLNMQPSSVVGSRAPIVAYQAFVASQHTTNQMSGDNLIALVAYTSSELNNTAVPIWASYQTLWSKELNNMQTSGHISKNYTIKPTPLEISTWQQFNKMWLSDMLVSNVLPYNARKSYNYSAQTFIFQVMDYEYKRQ